MAGNKKVSMARWPEGDVYFQLGGSEIGMKELKSRVIDDMEARVESSVKIGALDVYVKAADMTAYYVARSEQGEVGGSVSL